MQPGADSNRHSHPDYGVNPKALLQPSSPGSLQQQYSYYSNAKVSDMNELYYEKQVNKANQIIIVQDSITYFQSSNGKIIFPPVPNE